MIILKIFYIVNRQKHILLKKMKRFFSILVIISFCTVSCRDTGHAPIIPDLYINVSINPNSTQYFELNTVGGWMYLTAQEPSRGLIVYRYNWDEFKAYDRLSPYVPYNCDDRLYVDFPFVIDPCTGYKYSILDGSLLEGSGYNLIQYFTEYDGNILRIYN